MALEFDFSNLNKRLEEMATKTQTKTLDKVLDVGKEPILEEMRNNAPIDTHELQNSLDEIKRSGSGVKRISRLGIKSDDKSIQARGFYSEYGNERQVATHWMKKSFAKARGQAKEKMIQALKEELKL